METKKFKGWGVTRCSVHPVIYTHSHYEQLLFPVHWRRFVLISASVQQAGQW